jgi:site-specific recombinase XerD
MTSARSISSTRGEINAILAAPDRNSWIGRRDHMLLHLAVQTGLRVSEIVQLEQGAVVLGAGAHVRCIGKGRKERCTPLTTQLVFLGRGSKSTNFNDHAALDATQNRT